MALTISELSYVSLGNKRMRVGKIAFDSSYPTGGETLNPSTLGLDVIESIIFEGFANATPAAILLNYDYTNKKVRAFRQKDPGDAGGADIPFPEVGNTVDLSAFNGRFIAVGY